MAYMPNEGIKALAKALHDEIYSAENMLKRRGFTYSGHGATDSLIMPPNISKLNLDKYYDYMCSRTFRNILKNIVAKRENISQSDYLKTCGNDAKLSEYLNFLCSIGVVHHDGQSSLYSLKITANNFGPTLEWLVAETFKRELASTSDWGVKIEDFEPGGDFDVMTRIESELVWVETKSSHPQNISESDIKHFLQRDQNLEPDMSIFFVDTDDDLSDLVRVFEKIVTPVVDCKIKELRDSGGVYHFLRRIYIINSEPTILANLRNCRRHHFREAPYMHPSRERYKFL